jgi:hypothetical protein
MGWLGDWASWMAVIWVQIAKTVGRTEPDVHLIKQVEQVTMSALGGPTWRFARIPSMGGRGRRRNLVFLIYQLPDWLLFGCKNSQERPRAPIRRLREPGPMGCRAVPLPNSVRLIHHRANLACCPDFKVSHYPLTERARCWCSIRQLVAGLGRTFE